MGQILQRLRYILSELGIGHKVTPQSILLTRDGDVKIG